MRYYQNKQFNMLQQVSAILKKNKEKLSKKVPALGDIITDFVEWQEQQWKLKNTNKYAVSISTGQKRSTKEGLVDMVLKLQGVIQAHHYKNKPKTVRRSELAARSKAAYMNNE